MARRQGQTEKQILAALRQAEGGTTVAEICRDVGISEQTFYVWKRKYARLGLSELRELLQLREENTKLKRLVADLSLDRHLLQEIVQRKPYGLGTGGHWPAGRELLQIIHRMDQRIMIALGDLGLQQMQQDLRILGIVLIPGVIEDFACPGHGQRGSHA